MQPNTNLYVEPGTTFAGLNWIAAVTRYDPPYRAHGISISPKTGKVSFWSMITEERWLPDVRSHLDMKYNGRLGLQDHWS